MKLNITFNITDLGKDNYGWRGDASSQQNKKYYRMTSYKFSNLGSDNCLIIIRLTHI